MFSTPWIYVVVGGVMIIAALVFYAVKLLSQLKAQTAKIKQAEQDKKIALAKHDSNILSSVVIIAHAMKEEQCDIAEGCWRLSVLLDSLKLSSGLSAEFPAVFELYDKIKHMPILDARKKLAKNERMKLDFERMKAESDLSAQIKIDVTSLHQYAQERMSALAS
ncbi:MAG: Na+-transporting methylmalonyl-CoA/oxaloacetate decarboxylase gamma subunit [Colwellia sp.]|jgi:Na+-transporting methylmalonyl-CoA/oxaloacetate decarboxylase gamma subunit